MDSKHLRGRGFGIILALWIGLLLNTIVFWGDYRFRAALDAPGAIMILVLVVSVLAFIQTLFRRLRARFQAKPLS